MSNYKKLETLNAHTAASLYARWRLAENLVAVFSMLGVLTATIDYEISYSDYRTYKNCRDHPCQTCRWFTFIFTLIASFCLIYRCFMKGTWYRYRPTHFLPYKKQEKGYKKQIRKKKAFLSIGLIIELGILAIFPYPYSNTHVWFYQPLRTSYSDGENRFIHICYLSSEILYSLMFSRIYFVVRSLFDLTHYQDNYARLYCTMNRTKPGFSFSIRCFMRTYPKVFILALIIPSFLVLGCFMRIYERPYTDVSGYNFQVYSNAVWASAVAMATVGFGDLVPSTSLGRFVGFTSAVWGIFLFTLMVYTLQNDFMLNHREIKAFRCIRTTRSAAKAILIALAYNLSKKNAGLSSTQTKLQYKRLQRALEIFKEIGDEIDWIEIKQQIQVKRSIQSFEKYLDRFEAKIDMYSQVNKIL